MTETREAIKARFMKEYARKDFPSITVKGLCAATPVARTTFYSYYSNTDDVRCEIEDDLIGGLVAVSERVAAGNFPEMDFPAFMDATEDYIRENWTELHAFLVVQPNLRFIRKWKDAIRMNFGRRFPDKQGIPNFDALTEIMASALLSAYVYWMEHPDETDPGEIKPLIMKTLDALVSEL